MRAGGVLPAAGLVRMMVLQSSGPASRSRVPGSAPGAVAARPAPVSYKGKLVQYAGRILRPDDGKATAEVAHPDVVPLLVTRPLATLLCLRPRGTLCPLEDTEPPNSNTASTSSSAD